MTVLVYTTTTITLLERRRRVDAAQPLGPRVRRAPRLIPGRRRVPDPRPFLRATEQPPEEAWFLITNNNSYSKVVDASMRLSRWDRACVGPREAAFSGTWFPIHDRF